MDIENGANYVEAVEDLLLLPISSAGVSETYTDLIRKSSSVCRHSEGEPSGTTQEAGCYLCASWERSVEMAESSHEPDRNDCSPPELRAYQLFLCDITLDL